MSQTVAADRPPFRAAAGPRARARRQVDLAPRADPGRADGGRDPDHRPAGRRGRHQHRPRPCGRSARRVERTGRGRMAGARASASAVSRSRAGRSISAIPAPAAGWSWVRSPAARSRRRSTAMRRCARGRCGACSIRWSGWARVRWQAADGGRLPLTLAGRARSDPDRLRAAGRFGAAQVRRAARRPRGARRDHGDREARRRATTPSACCGISAPRLSVAPTARMAGASRCKGQPELVPAPVVVPADPSSAAFPMVAALIVPGSEIVLEGVMTNVTRTGLFTTLREMGAVDRGARSRASRAARTSPICACGTRR